MGLTDPISRQKAILWCCILLMIMPFQVTMLSEYLVLKQLGLLDTLAAVILPGIFQTLLVFIMYRFFCGVPNALLEAARIDGAGELGIFLKVGVPVGSSGIFSAMMLQFLECQSMVERPLIFLKNKKLWPLALYLPEITRTRFAMCASFVAMLPVLLMFFSGQESVGERRNSRIRDQEVKRAVIMRMEVKMTEKKGMSQHAVRILVKVMTVICVFTVLSRISASLTVAEVMVESPSAKRIEHIVDGEGVIGAQLETSVQTEVGLLVKSVQVKKGQKVEAGEVSRSLI